jgi:hypothetical protein
LMAKRSPSNSSRPEKTDGLHGSRETGFAETSGLKLQRS